MINTYLGQLLSSHQIPYTEKWGEYVIADHVSLLAIGLFPSGRAMECAFVLRIRDRTIIEWFGLPQAEEKAACSEFISYFEKSDFHAMMSYVFGLEDEHINLEEWNFGGTKRKLILGDSTFWIFGGLQARDLQLQKFAPWAREFIEMQKIESGLNWIRVYVGQFKGEIQAAELMINNRRIPGFMDFLRTKPLIKTDEFYSYRNFMIVRESDDYIEPERLLPLEDIATKILSTADKFPNLQDDEMITLIGYHSAGDVNARRCFDFFETGLFRRISHQLTGNARISFSDEYIIVDAKETIIETGKLLDQDWYNVAFTLPERLLTQNNIQSIAMLTSEANAIKSAIEKKANQDGSFISPLFIGSEYPTEPGVSRPLSQGNGQIVSPKKPRWKFW
jgi:Family of unknown function (DUF6348)